MKNLLILLFFISGGLFAGTCTSISRTNNAANSVLTSSKYNTDLNNILTFVNALDGGCIADGSLEVAAFNTTQFAPISRSVKNGCKVTPSDSNTVSTSVCNIGINDATIITAGATTTTWGCTGCAAEATGTTYYLYGLDTSTGATLNTKILTAAPNSDGYNATSDRALARFYNDASGNIDYYSIDQAGNSDDNFTAQKTAWIDAGVITIGSTGASAPTKGATTRDKMYWKRVGGDMLIRYEYYQANGGTAGGNNDYTLRIPRDYRIDTSKVAVYTTDEAVSYQLASSALGSCHFSDNSANTFFGVVVAYDDTRVRLFGISHASPAAFGYNAVSLNANASFAATFRVPIVGWND